MQNFSNFNVKIVPCNNLVKGVLHHTEGTPADGGDQFPQQPLKIRVEQKAVKKVLRLALNVSSMGLEIAQKMFEAGTAALDNPKRIFYVWYSWLLWKV
jgi:hypothetical protein